MQSLLDKAMEKIKGGEDPLQTLNNREESGDNNLTEVGFEFVNANNDVAKTTSFCYLVSRRSVRSCDRGHGFRRPAPPYAI